MLGGPDSFVEGKYDKTPIGELLPVYLNRPSVPQDDGEYRLVLTREGWLQPWVRVRKTEDEENKRLAGMSTFQTLSRSGEIKPGAVVLSEVQDSKGADGTGSCGAVVRQGARRGALDRRSVALGDAPREPGGRRLRSLVAADSPLAGRRRAEPRRSDGASQARFGDSGASASQFECAMPNIVRSTMPRSPFASVYPGVRTSRWTPSPTRVKPVLTRRLMFRESRVPTASSPLRLRRTGASSASERRAGRLSRWPTSLPASSPTAST